MQDTKLFETILGLQAPWHIARVGWMRRASASISGWSTTPPRLDVSGVPAHAARPRPRRGAAWRHLDTCQYQTFLHARVPRVQCPTHGVRQVRVPWAEARSRFTLLLERLVIDLILQCSTITGACRIARSVGMKPGA